MRILANLATAAGIAVLAASAAEATTLTVGNANSGNCAPFGCNISGITSGVGITYLEVYAGSAFSGAASIDSITFTLQPNNYVSDSPIAGTYDISFATTTQAVGTVYATLSGALSNTQTFFDGTLSAQVGSTYTITGTPYTFDPTTGENLVMEVTASDQADVEPGSDEANYFEADSTNNSISRAYYFNTADYFSYDTDDTGNGLVTTFGLGAPPPPAPEPATWSLLIVGVGLAGASLRGRHRRAAQA
jgi:hypothetical protein